MQRRRWIFPRLSKEAKVKRSAEKAKEQRLAARAAEQAQKEELEKQLIARKRAVAAKRKKEEEVRLSKETGAKRFAEKAKGGEARIEDSETSPAGEVGKAARRARTGHATCDAERKTRLASRRRPEPKEPRRIGL